MHAPPPSTGKQGAWSSISTDQGYTILTDVSGRVCVCVHVRAHVSLHVCMFMELVWAALYEGRPLTLAGPPPPPPAHLQELTAVSPAMLDIKLATHIGCATVSRVRDVKKMRKCEKCEKLLLGT